MRPKSSSSSYIEKRQVTGMFADYAHNLAEGLVKTYGRNPADIAQGLGIKVIENYDFKKLCGMYTVIKRKRIIFVNGNLSREMRNTVLSHELGHDLLHREIAVNSVVHDVMLYDMTARPEYEANVFAAELLIDDEEIRELTEVYGYDAEQAAAALGLDVNLVVIKVASMIERGFDYRGGGIDIDNGFLRGKE